MCQSPISRNTHFYKLKTSERASHSYLCQSPISRNTHFYNLHYGLSALDLVLCQSPISRNTHFYGGNQLLQGLLKLSVSISYISEHPFLLTMGKSAKRFLVLGVNLLYLGTPISTSPPKLLDFMRLSSLDFAGIYQNFLKKGMFLGF